MMQTHQQGKAGAGKLRTTIFSIIVVLIMLFGATITLAGMRIIPTKAATSSYPYATMPCVWSPYATDGPKAYKYQNAWCKLVDKNGNVVQYDDWGTIRNNNSNKSILSPYGYAYRNCTDYVAWKVSTLGVKPQQYKGLGNANKWADNAPSHGLKVNTTPAVGSAAVKTSGTFGHVAFVEKVGKDSKGNTILTVSEFNEYFDGDYNRRSGTLAQLGFSKFVHFEKYETGGTPTPTPTATPPPNNDQLAAVAAVSASDVWAVGEQGSSLNPQTLIEHWNGSSWSVVPSFNLGQANGLSGVAAVSANDVWAVGYASSYSSVQTLIEHWDGSSWGFVPSPTVGSWSILSSVAAVSANDIWAVGYVIGGTLTEHWDGSSWSVVPSPNPAGTSSMGLFGVAAVSSSDVWAVDYYNDSSSTINGSYTLIEHWDGNAWSLVPSPNATPYNQLLGVTASLSSDVWAVGVAGTQGPTVYTMIEHWDGSSWTLVSSPNASSYDSLSGVAAITSSDIWAVGYSGNPSLNSSPLAEQWNGSAWSVVSTPNPTGSANQLIGVTAISSSDVWAVGSNTGHTLTEHWNGTSWSVVPSANP